MNWLSEYGWAGWLIASGVLVVAELFSMDLILLMLATGAATGAVADLAGAPFPLAVLVAAVTSVGMLAMVRPSMVRRLHGGPALEMSHEKLVGQHAVVTSAMTDLQTGRVIVGSEEWSASPMGGASAIAVGEHVEVLAIRGATAYVAPLPFHPS